MTEKQVFGLIVRGLGVLVILDGARQAWFLIMRFAYPPSVFHYPFSLDLLYAVVVLMVGLALMRSPEMIVRLAWSEESESSR